MNPESSGIGRRLHRNTHSEPRTSPKAAPSNVENEVIWLITEKGIISVDPYLIERIKPGAKVKLKITVHDQKESKKELSPAAKRLFKRMEHAKPLGLPDAPRRLGHSALAEQRLEEKFSWSG